MLTLTQINAGLHAVIKTREGLNERLQELAVSITGHACEHGDVTLADRLLSAMGRGLDRQAMILYLEEVGPFRWSKTDSKFAFASKKAKEMVFDEEWLNGEDAPRWYELAKGKSALSSSFDVEEKMLAILKSAARYADNHKKTVEHMGLAQYVKDAINDYHADRKARLEDVQRAAAATVVDADPELTTVPTPESEVIEVPEVAEVRALVSHIRESMAGMLGN